MTEKLLTRDQITQSCLRYVAEFGLTKRRDQEVLARAWASLLALSQFMGDFDLLPVATQLYFGVQERLSHRGQREFVACSERQMAEDPSLGQTIAERQIKPTVAKPSPLKRAA